MQHVLFRYKFIAFLVQHPRLGVLWRTSLLRRLLQLSVPLLELCIINVPYVAFEDLVDSSLSTLTVTYLSHVTEALSPAFDAGTLFYEVNVTSLAYTVDASAKSDAATGLEVDEKAAHAIFTVHSTAPAYQKIEGTCLGPQCDHHNLHRARLLSALSCS